MSDPISFALSQEELLLSLALLELPVPIGADELEAQVFDDLPGEVRIRILNAAQRSLFARGFMLNEGDQVALIPDVRKLLKVSSQPEESWLILHRIEGQGTNASVIHHADQLYVAHVGKEGIHQFFQLAGPNDIAGSALQLVQPLNTSIQPNLFGTLAEATFSALTDQPERPRGTVLQQQLQAGGLEPEVAAALTHSFDELVSISSFLYFNFAIDSNPQAAFTILRASNAQWIVAPTEENELAVRAIPSETVRELLATFAQGSAALETR